MFKNVELAARSIELFLVIIEETIENIIEETRLSDWMLVEWRIFISFYIFLSNFYFKIQLP